MKRIARLLGFGIVILALLACVAWVAGVLYYLGPGTAGVRTALALLDAILCLSGLTLLAMRRMTWLAALPLSLGTCAPLLAWYGAAPSNERHWRQEVAVLPYATIYGDLVTVHNIRNFEYRTASDFDARYYDRTFDLKALDHVDLIAVYWAGPAIAHIFVSFGFGDEQLPISIEARKEVGEGYSSMAGFFRQFELHYVVADERDVLRLRTDFRRPAEDVYVYRLTAPVQNARRLFLEYMREVNSLRERPKFYNTLTSNCTTLILSHAAVNPDRLRFTWRVLLSGYLPEYAYDVGRLDQSMPFEQLRERAHINGRRVNVLDGSAYSATIRSHGP